MRRISYYYAVIDETGLCTNIAGVSYELEMDNFIYIGNSSFGDQHLGKYYIDGVWYERIYDEVDENGIPVEGSTYTDVPWSPSI